MRFRARFAFSLVELLVVMGVIAALIAMLLPALSRSRIQARSVACQSNLRQWANSVLSYASENNCALPRRGQGVQTVTVINRPADWFNALPTFFRQDRYVDRLAVGRAPRGDDGSVWSCPEFVEAIPHAHQFAYAMNMKLSTWNNLLPDKINRVGPTSALVFMADAPGPYASVLPHALGEYNPAARHKGRVNLAFLDGHVASFTAAEIGVGKGETERADVVWKPKYTTWAPN